MTKIKTSKLVRAAIVVLACLIAVPFAIAQTAFSFADIISAFSSNKVTIIEDGNEHSIRTNALTVASALSDAGLDVSSGDHIAPGSDAPIREDMRIHITRSFDVYVQCGQKITTLRVRGGTVRDALAAVGYSVDEDDTIEPSLETSLSEGMRIKYNSIEKRIEYDTQLIPFSIKEVKSSKLFDDQLKVAKQGQYGQTKLTYEVIYENGLEASRKLLSSLQTKAPVTKIVHIGTKERKKAITVAKLVKLSNDPRKDFSPPTTDMIEKVMSYEVTAYHDELRTATGTWPQVGTIAVNPKQIPYGTRLYVDGYGYGIAADTGAFRHSGKKQIDVYMASESECRKWGRRRNVKIYILKD